MCHAESHNTYMALDETVRLQSYSRLLLLTRNTFPPSYSQDIMLVCRIFHGTAVQVL